MKEFINATKCVSLSQFICWGIFILCDENKFVSQSTSEDIATISGIIIILALANIYSVLGDSYTKKHNLNSEKFYIFLFILWVLFSVLVTSDLMYLVENNYLHICHKPGVNWGCLMNGFEYLIQGGAMLIIGVLALVIKPLK